MRVSRPCTLAKALLCALVLSRLQRPAAAQATAAPLAVGPELQALGQAAATIFVGQITGIQHRPGSVEISFRVEQPVRGAVASTFVLREWAGQWAPQTMRYTVGQRVLAFLHAAGAGGFSSPVHGTEGLVPVVVQGAHAPELLDIRRVAAFVVRTPGTPLPTEANGAILLSEALGVVAPGNAGPEPHHVVLPVRGHAPNTKLAQDLAASEASLPSHTFPSPRLTAPVLGGARVLR